MAHICRDMSSYISICWKQCLETNKINIVTRKSEKTAVARLRHSKHAMTSLNKDPLLCNGLSFARPKYCLWIKFRNARWILCACRLVSGAGWKLPWRWIFTDEAVLHVSGRLNTRRPLNSSYTFTTFLLFEFLLVCDCHVFLCTVANQSKQRFLLLFMTSQTLLQWFLYSNLFFD
jgi:hypothetical protein